MIAVFRSKFPLNSLWKVVGLVIALLSLNINITRALNQCLFVTPGFGTQL